MESDKTEKTQEKGPATPCLEWFPYIVRWHFKAVKGKIHSIKSKGFKTNDEAKNFFDSVSKQFAKKLITPLVVENYSPTWAQYIPGGSLIEPYMVSYYVSTEDDDIVETYVKYFSDGVEAKKFYDELEGETAKKLTTPYCSETNNKQLSIVLP
jgi:hypothetical protein